MGVMEGKMSRMIPGHKALENGDVFDQNKEPWRKDQGLTFEYWPGTERCGWDGGGQVLCFLEQGGYLGQTESLLEVASGGRSCETVKVASLWVPGCLQLA